MTERAGAIQKPDDIYAALIALHEGKSEEESLRLWAKLVILLIGEVADDKVALRLIAEAGQSQKT